MPTNGLVWWCDQLEYAFTASVSSSAPIGGWPACDFIVAHADTAVTVSEALRFTYSQQKIKVTLFGSDLGNATATTAKVVFDGLKVYALPGTAQWKTVWTGWEAFIAGSSVATGGAGSSTGSNFTPGGVPVFGAPPTLMAGTTAFSPTFTPGTPCGLVSSPGSGSNSSDATFTGGYRFKRGSTWYAMPIDLPESTHLPANAPTFGGSTTYDASITLHAEASWTSVTSGGSWVSTDIEGQYNEATLGIIATPEKKLNRFNTDFAAAVDRYGIPGTRYTVNSNTPGGSTTAYDTITDEHATMIEVLTGTTTGTIEEPFGEPSYCQVNWNAYQWTEHAYCDGGTVAQDFDYYSQDGEYPTLVGGSSMAGYLSHLLQNVENYNRIAHPYWSFLLDRDDWEVDGTPQLPEDYWDKIGTQWLYDAALPTIQQRRSRNTLITEPLMASPWRSWLDTTFAGNRWLGISRWHEVTVSWPTSVFALTTGWSLTNCTRSGTSSHTFTYSGSGGSYQADWDMGQWSEPYMHPHLCREIKVSLSGADAAATTAFLVGVDGTEVEIPTGSWQVRPRGSSTKHAGSWAEDRGVGVVSDQGVDTGATGISSATMGDTERSFAFSLLPGRTAQYVRLKMAGTTSVVVSVEMRASDQPTILPEHRTSTTFLWADGPGVRVGSWSWWDTGGATWHSPPSLEEHGYTPTAFDGLVNLRQIFEARAKDDGLRTAILALWDMTELNLTGTPTDAQVFAAADYASMSFWRMKDGDLTLYLVNTAREVPPVNCLPSLEGSTWRAGTTIWAQEPRYHIAPGAATQLTPSGGTPNWLTPRVTLSGWDIRAHEHALDNSESDFRIKTTKAEYAHDVRPWHGIFWIGGAEVGGGGISYHVYSARHVLGVATDGTAEVSIMDNLHPQAPSLSSAGDAESICIRWLHSGELIRWVHDDTDAVLEARSQDGGLTWSTMARTVTSSGKWPAGFVGADERKRVYWVDGDTIKGEITDALNNVIESTFTVVGSNVADSGIAAWESVIGSTRRVILWYTDDSANLVEIISEDGGKTFA